MGKIVFKNPETTTTLDGMMTFGTTDKGEKVLDFKTTECVEMEALVTTCILQVMHNGDVYIVESALTAGKRNPRVFDGRYITITRRDDGSLRLNFKSLRVGRDFSVETYAVGVFCELRNALKGLLEN